MSRDLPGLAVALGLMILGVLFLVEGASLSAMGGVFPMPIAAIMVVTGVLFVAQRLLRPSRPAERASGDVWRRLAVIAVLLAWAILFPLIGFVVTGIVAFLAIFVIAQHDPWTPRAAITGIAVALVATLVAWWLMARVLYIPMPRGVLF